MLTSTTAPLKPKTTYGCDRREGLGLLGDTWVVAIRQPWKPREEERRPAAMAAVMAVVGPSVVVGWCSPPRWANAALLTVATSPLWRAGEPTR